MAPTNEQSKPIPLGRKVTLQGKELELEQSYGGTIYGVSVGGTKLVYDMRKMKEIGKSPLSRSPLHDLPCIPGITKSPKKSDLTKPQQQQQETQPAPEKDTMFDMEL